MGGFSEGAQWRLAARATRKRLGPCVSTFRDRDAYASCGEPVRATNVLAGTFSVFSSFLRKGKRGRKEGLAQRTVRRAAGVRRPWSHGYARIWPGQFALLSSQIGVQLLETQGHTGCQPDWLLTKGRHSDDLFLRGPIQLTSSEQGRAVNDSWKACLSFLRPER